jgi:hypothetical protein
MWHHFIGEPHLVWFFAAWPEHSILVSKEYDGSYRQTWETKHYFEKAIKDLAGVVLA